MVVALVVVECLVEGVEGCVGVIDGALQLATDFQQNFEFLRPADNTLVVNTLANGLRINATKINKD